MAYNPRPRGRNEGVLVDDEKINRFFATTAEQILALQRQITNLTASVVVLKTATVAQMNPDDPLEGAKILRNAEELILSRDPDVKQLEEAEQLMEAVKLWKKHGSPPHQS
jgi:hypothetical protein